MLVPFELSTTTEEVITPPVPNGARGHPNSDSCLHIDVTESRRCFDAAETDRSSSIGEQEAERSDSDRLLPPRSRGNRETATMIRIRYVPGALDLFPIS